MERARKLVNMALQMTSTAGTSNSGNSFSVIQLLELKRFIIVPTNKIMDCNSQDLHMVRYGGKNCECTIVDSGDKSEMEHILHIMIRYANTTEKYKHIGMTSSTTQTKPATQRNTETQTDEINLDTTQAKIQIEEINLHAAQIDMNTGDDQISLPVAVEYSEDFVSEDEQLNYVTGQDAPPLVGDDPISLPVTVEYSEYFVSEDGQLIYATEQDAPTLVGDTSLHVLDNISDLEGVEQIEEYPLPSMQDQEPQPIHTKKKKHFCKFCKKLKSNIARHFLHVHGEEEEVVSYHNLPTKSPERRRLESSLRRSGDAEYNVILSKEGLSPVPVRKGVSDTKTLPCPNCKLLYSKATLNRHYKLCANTRAPKNLLKVAAGMTRSEHLPKELCTEFKEHVLPGMSQDNVNEAIFLDKDIMEFGNSLSLRHAGDIQQKKNLIRSQMRSVSKVRLLATEVDNSISCLKDLFHPSKWNVFIEACRLFGNISKPVNEASPYNIIHVGLYMLNIAKDLKAATQIDEEGKKIREEIQAWIELYDRKFNSTIGKHAMKVAREKKWNQKSYLPLTEDVMKLNKYLKEQIHSSTASLKEKFSIEAFDQLNKATMLHLLTFNRKRVSEVKLFKITDFLRKEKIQEGTDAFNSLEESEKIFANRFFHVNIKGKWHRPVPVLITQQHSNAIDVIIKMREEAGVHPDNLYLFGKGFDQCYDASECMRMAALECKAEKPENLTTTRLRKQVSTVAQSLDLSENDLRVLSGFLGHTVQTHLEHYRQPSNVLHVARVSKIMSALDQGEIAKYKGKKIDDINVEVEDVMFSEETEELIKTSKEISGSHLSTVQGTSQKIAKTNTLSPKKCHIPQNKKIKTPTKKSHWSPLKQSPLKILSPIRRSKIRWSEDEKKIMRLAFAEHFQKGTLPSFNECYQVRSLHKGLEGRQVQKMKAWVNNEMIRRKRKHNESDTE